MVASRRARVVVVREGTGQEEEGGWVGGGIVYIHTQKHTHEVTHALPAPHEGADDHHVVAGAAAVHQVVLQGHQDGPADKRVTGGYVHCSRVDEKSKRKRSEQSRALTLAWVLPSPSTPPLRPANRPAGGWRLFLLLKPNKFTKRGRAHRGMEPKRRLWTCSWILISW